MTAAANPASTIELPGLHEDNPRDFLAALGLLRLVDMKWREEHRISLSWGPQKHLVLSSTPPLPKDWIKELSEDIQKFESDDPHPFKQRNIIKQKENDFRQDLIQAMATRNSSPWLQQINAMLFPAFSSQLPATDEKGNSKGNLVAASAFSFSNGQSGKNLLRDICELIRSEFLPDRLKQDLQGENKRPAKSLRWCPHERRTAAYRGHDPGAKTKGDEMKDNPCLNVLAFFGLSFYPVVDRVGASRTLGMFSDKRRTFFTWPIWTTPLGVDSVVSILHLNEIHVRKIPKASTLARGISRIWRSERVVEEKSLYFAPALPVT